MKSVPHLLVLLILIFSTNVHSGLCMNPFGCGDMWTSGGRAYIHYIDPDSIANGRTVKIIHTHRYTYENSTKYLKVGQEEGFRAGKVSFYVNDLYVDSFVILPVDVEGPGKRTFYIFFKLNNYLPMRFIFERSPITSPF